MMLVRFFVRMAHRLACAIYGHRERIAGRSGAMRLHVCERCQRYVWRKA